VKAKRAAIYVRVSSGEQNTGPQERALREYVQRRGWKLQQIYRDQGVSGASSNRPALNELLKACRRGSVDAIVVWKFDRFARSLKQLMSGLETCRAPGIDFVSVSESIDTSLSSGELVFQMIGAVAQFERSLIAERVKSGLANARAKGKVLGRPPLRSLTQKTLVISVDSDAGTMFRSDRLPRSLGCQCGPHTNCVLGLVDSRDSITTMSER
jgi:DNA invertase Pin-like site-specific DNA recombinase